MVLQRLASALSPITVLNTLAGMARVREMRDIPFSGGQSLDVYLPSRLDGPAPPAVIFYYGGGWESGERAMYRFVGAALAAKGLIAIIPDYRVYPEVRFPDFLRDAAVAVRWARDNLGRLGGDPRRLLVAGHSAGAHIAAMLAIDRQWLGDVGLSPDRDLRGFVGLSGPYDFLPLTSPTLKTIFGPEGGLEATQPITFVDRRVVPSLIATGAGDRVVDPANSTRLAARIRQFGGEVRLKLFPNIGHELVVGAFSPLLRPFAPVLRDTVSFAWEIAGEPLAAAAFEPTTREPA